MVRKTSIAAAFALALLPAIATAQVVPATEYDPGIEANEWLLSGSVGSTFAGDTEDQSVDFGFGLGYLYRGWIGGEFRASFAPSFNIEGRDFEEQPNVNTFMANALFAVPAGDQAAFQPYVTGGVGAMTFRTDLQPDEVALLVNEFGFVLPVDVGEVSATEWAWNAGAGILAFRDRWGIRGDVRFTQAMETDADSDDAGDNVAAALLDDLGYWRATVGVAYRW